MEKKTNSMLLTRVTLYFENKTKQNKTHSYLKIELT